MCSLEYQTEEKKPKEHEQQRCGNQLYICVTHRPITTCRDSSWDTGWELRTNRVEFVPQSEWRKSPPLTLSANHAGSYRRATRHFR